jgi:hypothetical protein
MRKVGWSMLVTILLFGIIAFSGEAQWIGMNNGLFSHREPIQAWVGTSGQIMPDDIGFSPTITLESPNSIGGRFSFSVLGDSASICLGLDLTRESIVLNAKNHYLVGEFRSSIYGGIVAGYLGQEPCELVSQVGGMGRWLFPLKSLIAPTRLQITLSLGITSKYEIQFGFQIGLDFLVTTFYW